MSALVSGFVDIIVSFLDKQNTHRIMLNKYEIQFIKNAIAADPNLFQGINIGLDGDITEKDIPQIVLLISNAYTQNKVSSNVNINIINVIEFTAYVLIESLPLPQIQQDILIEVLQFCFELLKKNIPLIEQKQKQCGSFIVRSFNYMVHAFTSCKCCKKK